ncbi:MAG: hypothetical protein IJK69_05490 [Oscillospiraceae bacterium]|nr:hypothetical protein [Oscillospiraceae bacterium]
MKRFLALLTVLVMLMFCGCTKAKVEYEQATGTSMFIVVEKGSFWDVVYHRETKVMYAISRGAYNSGNLCLLVNPDGTPMLWEGGGEDG